VLADDPLGGIIQVFVGKDQTAWQFEIVEWLLPLNTRALKQEYIEMRTVESKDDAINGDVGVKGVFRHN
jgi:hypothetical protein